MCDESGKISAGLYCAMPKAGSNLSVRQRSSDFAESVQQGWCRKMAEFAERLKVMRKANYNRETELKCDAEHREENGTDADALQIRVQRAVRRADTCAELRADVCAVIRAEPFANIRAVVGAKPRAVIRAVVLADDYVEKCRRRRNALQK